MKPARIVVICIAAVAAIGLALVVRAMGSSGQAVSTAAAAPAPVMAKVLVAAADLPPGKRLSESDLTWKDWPVDQVNPAFVTDGSTPLPAVEAKPADEDKAKDAEAAPQAAPKGAVARVTRAANDLATGGAKADFVGAVVREAILAGEPIVARKIVRAGEGGFMAAYLEPGMRAMAIRVTVETAAGGFILPGDRVDLVLTRETNLGNMATADAQRSKFTSATVLQNIKILAIDQTTRAADDANTVVGATATLELGPRDAEALAAARSEGELSLVLRSYADSMGPSGRVASQAGRTQQASTVRVYRGDAPEVVVVQ